MECGELVFLYLYDCFRFPINIPFSCSSSRHCCYGCHIKILESSVHQRIMEVIHPNGPHLFVLFHFSCFDKQNTLTNNESPSIVLWVDFVLDREISTV